MHQLCIQVCICYDVVVYFELGHGHADQVFLVLEKWLGWLDVLGLEEKGVDGTTFNLSICQTCSGGYKWLLIAVKLYVIIRYL